MHSSLGMMFYVEESNALQMLTLAEVLGSVMYRINRNLFGRTASAQAVHSLTLTQIIKKFSQSISPSPESISQLLLSPASSSPFHHSFDLPPSPL